MRIVSYEGNLCIGYHKSALSVIESAIYAHDAEKKWIQSHPTILYEMEVLKSAMGTLTSIFSSKSDSNPLFCYESLTEKGKNISLSIPLFSNEAQKLLEKGKFWIKAANTLFEEDNLFANGINIDTQNFFIKKDYHISLLADDDILHLMKEFCKDGLGFEYFLRNNRRSSVWKSEAEFRALFQQSVGDNSKIIINLEKDFERLANFCQDKTGVPIVNVKILDILKREEKELQGAKEADEIDQELFEDIVKEIDQNRHWVEVLKTLATELKLEAEFLIIFQKKFNSSFKETIGDIPILFPNITGSVVPFKNVSTVLNSGEERKSNFFHLYYKPVGVIDDKRKKEIVNIIAKGLIAKTHYQ